MSLLDEVLSKNNIEAYKKVYQNKGAKGVDGVTVYEFRDYLDKHFEEIKERIKTRKYKPSPVRKVYIPKDNGDKRELGIPTVIDRVIQQAIVQVLTPIYEKLFSETSYGFRPKRLCEMAIIKALEYFNDGYDWIVDIDLDKFFDNVCHDKIISLILKTVKDGDLVLLIRKYLVAGVMENGVVQETKKGTPQGDNLSPLLSNIMLNELDKELERRGLRFVRYADDCLIMVRSEKAANRVMDSIIRYIEKKLGLKVNATKSKVARPKDIKYFGFGFYIKPGQDNWRPKPHIKSIQKFKRKLKQITKRSYSISLAIRIQRLNYVIRGWINYFRIADMKGKMKEITSHLNRRIRCLLWKQRKTCKGRYTRLIRLGVSKIKVKELNGSRKSYWNNSMNPTIHIVISNKRLKANGLVFPLDHYTKVHIEL